MELNEKYPHLLFKKHWELPKKSIYLLSHCVALIESISHSPVLPKHYEGLMRVSLIKGAQATTAIEGNTLTINEIEDIYNGKSLPPSKEYQEIEVKNILDALNSLKDRIVFNDYKELIKEELLLQFHRAIGKNLGEHFDAIPGKFRTDQRVVGRYKCPDYNDVIVLVRKLCNWLREEFHYPKEQGLDDIIIQAIITHVYIEWIHPFSDGNGRTGRLVEFYILLRGGCPDIASHILSNFYNETRTEYYRQLDAARKKRDLSDFIEYALTGFCDGLKRTQKVIQKSQFEIIWQKLIHDKFSENKEVSKVVSERQKNLMLEIPIDEHLVSDNIKFLTPKIAHDYAKVSLRTMLRDISDLVKMELLIKSGKYYQANTSLLKGFLPKSNVNT